ncbi:hypothetical protein DPMN_051418 [Dreissena polymorpha]|uniref:Uncharacterized protein n=1 Tax=Dreissena polymorpha TaxID=45954 RepID=A0A9D4CJA6_DREPO|nr:hypothetical protein DPMN_051418 [Dreissena polymorpha]
MTGTILQLKIVKETNVLTKVHEDWAKIETSRPYSPPILTIFELIGKKCDFEGNYIAMSGKLTRPWRPCFQPTRTIFEFKKRHIIYTHFGKVNVTSRNSVEFHEDRTRNAVDRISP